MYLDTIGFAPVPLTFSVQGSAAALEAFLHEYRIGFPVGIDSHGPRSGLPRTMEYYQMRGTPTELLFDRAGELRMQHFGHLEDLRLGANIATLLAEPAPAPDNGT